MALGNDTYYYYYYGTCCTYIILYQNNTTCYTYVQRAVAVSRGYTIITGRLARKNNDVSRNNTIRRQSQEYCAYDVRFAIFIIRLHTPQDTTYY